MSDNPSRPNPAEIDVAAEAGVYVPTLCYLKDHPALGTCRACVVNVDGRVVPACTVTVSDRMRVEVNEPETTDMRQALVETFRRRQSQLPQLREERPIPAVSRRCWSVSRRGIRWCVWRHREGEAGERGLVDALGPVPVFGTVLTEG